MASTEIRKAILEGDIDQALGLIDTCYPNVLMANELVYFKLKCRRFIEMVRRAAEIRLHFEGKKSNGVDPSQVMDVDTNGIDADTMDTEDGPEYLDELQDLERDVIEYGQQLQAEYKSDPRKEVQKTLEDIWSLMAYPNPLREPKVAHLMDNGERSTTAEMVNSMILRKCLSVAALIRVCGSTNWCSSVSWEVVEGGPHEALRGYEQPYPRIKGGRARGLLLDEGHHRFDPEAGGPLMGSSGWYQAVSHISLYSAPRRVREELGPRPGRVCPPLLLISVRHS